MNKLLLIIGACLFANITISAQNSPKDINLLTTAMVNKFHTRVTLSDSQKVALDGQIRIYLTRLAEAANCNDKDQSQQMKKEAFTVYKHFVDSVLTDAQKEMLRQYTITQSNNASNSKTK